LFVSRFSSGSSPLDLDSLDRTRLKKQGTSFGWLFWAVLAGWSVRLIAVALVYKGFLEPGRDHWEFGYELGRVARSIAVGLGFSNPYWADTGPTALLTPIYPYLLASVFAVFGVYTKASALVFLAINTFFSAVTSVPIFLIARKNFDLRTAKIAACVWAFFPYAINLSATTMWYHSFLALLLAVIFLLVLSLASSDRLTAWAALGALLGFAALTNPVIVGIAPFLGGWLWAQLAQKGKRALAATSVGLIAMVVTILPWVVRNELVLHQPVVFKDGFWLEVCVGNVNNSLHWWDGDEHPSGSAWESAQYERWGESSYMAAKRRRAIVYIETHPGAYALRSLRHVVFMWTGFWSFNREYLRQEPFDPENICFLSLLSLLSIAGLYHMFREGRRTTAMLYFLVLFSFPIPYCLSHLDPGFRHPVDPLLVILACSAITRFLPQTRVPAAAREEIVELALR
jgi:4-amino-4-deoxy-L-arabinose transferase-like glycosyltransferase